MRLSPPTTKTFLPALALIVIGVALWVIPGAAEAVSPDVAFWSVTAGGVLLVLGSLFNRI